MTALAVIPLALTYAVPLALLYRWMNPTPPKPIDMRLLKRKQTYAEYVAAFVPSKPSPRIEKFADCIAKVFVCLLVLVVLVTLAALVIAGK